MPACDEHSIVYPREVMRKMELELTRVFTFDAAHYVVGHKGRCAGLHGHTYRLEVTVKGACGESGMVLDFQTLKDIVDRSMIQPFLDHHCLNETLPVNPTAENIVIWAFDWWEEEVARQLPGVRLERLVLWETPNSCVSLSRKEWEKGRRPKTGCDNP